MNIDEDDFSDEYDFMDEDDEEGKVPKLKYKELLQKVADRYEEEITIDLDDLAKVDRPPYGDVCDSNNVFQ
jgi:DNA replication licensing factor MCM7